MDAFTRHTGIVVPLDRPNVDTDAIIPKQFLKSVKRTGFGPNLFDEWRYMDHGQPDSDNSRRPINPDFVLNQPRYQGASVLLARDNFGCGSSREHAPWALLDYGIRCVIAPSFADIFFNNCFKNGILPLVLQASVMNTLFADCIAQEGYVLSIDLPRQTVMHEDVLIGEFEVDEYRKNSLLEGLDDIDQTLKYADNIRAYEASISGKKPWL